MINKELAKMLQDFVENEWWCTNKEAAMEVIADFVAHMQQSGIRINLLDKEQS